MTHRGWLVALALLGLTATTLATGWAQVTPAPAAPPRAPDVPATSGWAAALFVLAVLGLIVILAAIAKYHDVRNRREADALAIQSRLSDALLTDQALHGLAVTPTVHVPLSGSPAIVEVTGDVPSPEARERILRVVKREAQSLRADVEVEDKLLVLPPVRARAA